MEVFYISVLNLRDHVTRVDVRNHFEKILPTSQPKVSVLVSERESGLQSTTVALRLDKSDHLRRASLQKLMAAPLIDSRGDVSHLRVLDDWEGMTALAETDSDPSFE